MNILNFIKPVLLFAMLAFLQSSCAPDHKKEETANATVIVPQPKDTNTINIPKQNSFSTPILFSLDYKLPSNVPLNISFTLDGKQYKYYGHGMQYSEIDGSVFTEFSITGEIFSATSYDYGEGPLPDGISLSYNDSAVLNKPMQVDNDKTYLKIKGVEYKQETGTMIITQVNGNLVNGTFKLAVHTKNGKLLIIDDGIFTDLPVWMKSTENE